MASLEMACNGVEMYALYNGALAALASHAGRSAMSPGKSFGVRIGSHLWGHLLEALQ